MSPGRERHQRRDWWNRLRRVMQRREQHQNPREAARQRRTAEKAIAEHLDEIALPALRALCERLTEEGFAATVERHPNSVRLTVVRDDENYCVYEVSGRIYFRPSFAFPNLHGDPDRPQHPVLRIECEGLAHEWELERATQDTIYEDALERCSRWLEW